MSAQKLKRWIEHRYTWQEYIQETTTKLASNQFSKWLHDLAGQTRLPLCEYFYLKSVAGYLTVNLFWNLPTACQCHVKTELFKEKSVFSDKKVAQQMLHTRTGWLVRLFRKTLFLSVWMCLSIAPNAGEQKLNVDIDLPYFQTRLGYYRVLAMVTSFQSTTMRNLRFSKRYYWRFKSSGMLRRVD